ncbi:MAG: hypothetical protein U5Q03_09810 [Bacteroidota bacterium]|nr:hypothetical protein [Bacteroidota bacterium]
MTQRPLFLSLLCIASLVYNGLVMLLLIAAFFFRNYLAEMIRNYADAKAPETSLYVFLFTGLLLTGLAFYGVLKIWQLRKIGFLLFFLSNVLIMIVLYLFFTLSLWHLISSILLLFLFWIYAKRMK